MLGIGGGSVTCSLIILVMRASGTVFSYRCPGLVSKFCSICGQSVSDLSLLQSDDFSWPMEGDINQLCRNKVS